MQSTQKSLNTDNQIELYLFNSQQWKILVFGFVMPTLYNVDFHTESHWPGTAEVLNV